MGIIRLSVFAKHAGSAVFALFLAACSQPAIVESSTIAGSARENPSPAQGTGHDNLGQLAQLESDTCRQQSENAGTLDLGDKSARSTDIVDFFKSRDCPKIRTRQVKKITDLTDSPKKLSMQINFEFNSSKLTAAGKRALRPVAEALASSELHDKHFVIEGHTDAKGRSSYNLSLSKRRAQSVKYYLVNQFNLEPGRFQTIGKGSTELLNSTAPYAAENRRVVIALPR